MSSGSLRTRGSQKYFWTMVWSGVGTIVLGWMSLRRLGIGSDYPRLENLCTSGEYRTLLEPGAIPDNPFLPPHMRLDMKSYLDPPDCRIACPPMYDLSISEKSMRTALRDVIPEDEQSSMELGIGPLRSRGTMTSLLTEERFIKRRLGMSEDSKARL